MVFGCETRETGEIFNQEADGILGLGNSPISLVNQARTTIVLLHATATLHSNQYPSTRQAARPKCLRLRPTGLTRLSSSMDASDFMDCRQV